MSAQTDRRLHELLQRACSTPDAIANALSASEWHELRDCLVKYHDVNIPPPSQIGAFEDAERVAWLEQSPERNLHRTLVRCNAGPSVRDAIDQLREEAEES